MCQHCVKHLFSLVRIFLLVNMIICFLCSLTSNLGMGGCLHFTLFTSTDRKEFLLNAVGLTSDKSTIICNSKKEGLPTDRQTSSTPSPIKLNPYDNDIRYHIMQFTNENNVINYATIVIVTTQIINASVAPTNNLSELNTYILACNTIKNYIFYYQYKKRYAAKKAIASAWVNNMYRCVCVFVW